MTTVYPIDDDPFAPPAQVMTREQRRQLYRTPHVHDPDGSCVRNRYRTYCAAPYQPDNPEDSR